MRGEFLLLIVLMTQVIKVNDGFVNRVQSLLRGRLPLVKERELVAQLLRGIAFLAHKQLGLIFVPRMAPIHCVDVAIDHLREVVRLNQPGA